MGLKTVMHIPVWGRPDVLAVTIAGVNRLCDEIEGFEPFFVISPEEDISQSLDMVVNSGHEFIEYPNSPLSNKQNYGIQTIRTRYPDLVIIGGSDNIFSTKYVRRMMEFAKAGVHFAGSTDFYVMDKSTKKVSYWPGYPRGPRMGETAGPGRMLSRELLDRLHWMPWQMGINRSLDGSFMQKIKDIDIRTAKIRMKKDPSIFGLDIKGSDNITPISGFDKCKNVDCDRMKSYLSDKEIELIEKL